MKDYIEPELNIKKIQSELDRIGATWTWLAAECGRTQPITVYWKRVKPIKAAARIAAVFGLDAKDLIKQ